MVTKFHTFPVLGSQSLFAEVKYPQNYVLAQIYRKEEGIGGIISNDGLATLVRRIAKAKKPIISYYLKYKKIVGIHVEGISENTERKLETLISKLSEEKLRKIERSRLVNEKVCY